MSVFKFPKGCVGFSIGKFCVAVGKGKGVQISHPRLFRIVLNRGIVIIAYAIGFVEIVGWRVSAGFFDK